MDSNIYHKITSYYGNNKESLELVAFYSLLQKFSVSTIKDIYPNTLFESYYKKLAVISLIDENIINRLSDNTFKVEKLYGINTEWIRYFVVLAESESFTIAAKNLSITDSTLSKAVSGIEDILQVILIERENNFCELTYFGKKVYKKFKEILINLKTLSNEITQLNSGTKGEVKISWNATWGKDLITDSLKFILKEYPNIIFKIYDIEKLHAESEIVNEFIDIAFLNSKPLSNLIEVAGVIDVEFVIVGNKQQVIEWEELQFIHCTSFQYWNDLKYPRKIIVETNSLMSLRNSLKSH